MSQKLFEFYAILEKTAGLLWYQLPSLTPNILSCSLDYQDIDHIRRTIEDRSKTLALALIRIETQLQALNPSRYQNTGEYPHFFIGHTNGNLSSMKERLQKINAQLSENRLQQPHGSTQTMTQLGAALAVAVALFSYASSLISANTAAALGGLAIATLNINNIYPSNSKTKAAGLQIEKILKDTGHAHINDIGIEIQKIHCLKKSLSVPRLDQQAKNYPM